MATDYPNETQPLRDIPIGPYYPTQRQFVFTGLGGEIDSVVGSLVDKGTLVRLEQRELVFPELANDTTRSDRFIQLISDRKTQALERKLTDRERWWWERFVNVAELLKSGTPGVVVTRTYGVSAGVNPQTIMDAWLGDPALAALRVAFEPCAVVGDPQIIGGSPATGMYANRGAFSVQWAFGDAGIALPDPTSVTGAGVRVGVFDTSPFDIPFGPQPCLSDTTAPCPTWMPWQSKIYHPPLAHLGPIANMVPCPDHGLCISSLIQHVARACEIELYRVLNMFVEGDDVYLAGQLGEFIDRATGVTSAPLPAHGAVINLSLHVDTSRLPAGISSPVDYQLTRAEASGIIVVAAAGNHSQADAPQREDPEYPANLATVIGAAALSQEGQPAFWANTGDVLAPGSDLIGMVTHEPPTAQNYQYVNGSSYATALVAGVSALAREQCGVAYPTAGYMDVPRRLRDAMGIPTGSEPHITVANVLAEM